MICVPCKRIYRPSRNGVTFQEMMPGANSMQPDPETGWSPYKLWAGDQWKCPGCGHEIIGGIPLGPISEHYKPEYYMLLQQYQARGEVLNIADCGPIHGGQGAVPKAAPDVEKINRIVQDLLETVQSTESAMLLAREELKEVE